MRGKTHMTVFSKAVQDHMSKKYIGNVLLGNFSQTKTHSLELCSHFLWNYWEMWKQLQPSFTISKCSMASSKWLLPFPAKCNSSCQLLQPWYRSSIPLHPDDVFIHRFETAMFFFFMKRKAELQHRIIQWSGLEETLKTT